MKLYHVSGWDKLKFVSPGDVIRLNPGPQGAEGTGVYFSEGVPRITAAEGARTGVTGIIIIERPASTQGWYRTKNCICRKYNRPRTWHTVGKSIDIEVENICGIFIFGKEVKK